MTAPSSTTRGLWYADEDTDFSEMTGAIPPRKFLFSLTGKCNLRCGHCPRGVLDVRASETPIELVDHVIHDILPSIRSIRLGGTDLGEQLTSRHFNRFLEAILESQPKHFELVTNLTVLDEKRASLIARACSELGLSLEGIGSEFERIRKFPWSTIVRNLEMLNEAKARHPENQLEVFGLVTCFFDNLEHLEEILDLADMGVRRFEFRLFRPNVPSQATQALEHHRGRANEIFARIVQRAAAEGLQVAVPPPFPIAPLVPEPDVVPVVSSEVASTTWICHFPFEAMSLYSDGKVSPCCEELYLGQVDSRKPDLLSVFRSEPWRELRKSLAEGRPKGRCVDCELRRGRQALLDSSPALP